MGDGPAQDDVRNRVAHSIERSQGPPAVSITSATTWASALAGAIWIPLLALDAGYPSVEQVVRTPSIRAAVGYSIAICLAIVVAVSVPSGVVARLVSKLLERDGLFRSGAFCGVVSASAMFVGYMTILVHRGPAKTITGDFLGLALVLCGAVLLGAMVEALAMLETHRSGRGWIPYAVGIIALATWAYVTHDLIVGTSAANVAFSTWPIAVGVALIGVGQGLDRWKRTATIVAGVVLVVGCAIPAMKLFPPRPGIGPPPALATKSAPNVVVVLIDTWRWDMTDFGNPRLGTTPSLDALAADHTTLFTTATAAAPATVPSVKAMITGFPPSHFGLFGWGRMPPPADAWTMARAFREAGYATSAFVASELVQSAGFESGFQHYWCASAVGNVEHSFFLQLVARRNYWRTQKLAEKLHIFKTHGDVVVDRFADWLGNHHDRPFFSYIHIVEPHWPYENRGYGYVPKDLRNLAHPYSHVDLEQLRMGDPKNASYRGTPELREMIGRYKDEVRDADRVVGRVIDTLASRHQSDDTLLIVVGDHGEEFFEHDGYGHGQDVYQELLHVPLVVHWPRRQAFAGFQSSVSSPVSLMDLFPTLTDILHLPQPHRPFRGRSLRPELEGLPHAPDPLVSETLWGDAHAAFRLGDLKARVVFDSRHVPSDGGRVRVFDLATDPEEQHPIRVDDERTRAFLDDARRTLDATWSRALKATSSELPPTKPTGNSRDEALERLRALGYLR